MRDFHLGKFHILIATDVVVGGIDIQDVMRIINYDISNKGETYVCHIGRSARLGRSGTVIPFVSQYDDFRLQELEEYLGNVLGFHGSSEFEAVIAGAETLRELGIPKSQRKGKREGAAQGYDEAIS